MIKKDSLWLGAVCGMLGPIAGFWIYYFMQFSKYTPLYLLYNAIHGGFLSALLSLSLLANLALFFIFIKIDADRSARGVLLATIIYAFAGFIIKFFL